ncbi:MAG: OB-fold nucleic acid binding domain-containing protein [Candidatus Nanoarchaeia archaeon]|nr:OB-fold nucleic acid binding domain-containing protein [Candidatus Nanoarchaeia archaeon]MDD5054268.1 OB-fold nucleic acid binding domain-containing protein [Candidatus Nanoarchaeia archaeon]MDD5499346.1 OB-fold nucleic acid binding domain-containing protein [Candidatus Nanoarchaeia archaeon]
MISKLIPGMTNVQLLARVISKEAPRTVNTKYGSTKVCDAVLKDETGEIGLTLWSEQISKIKEGDEVIIKGGYTSEWQGEVKLNIPKRSEITKKEE